MTREPHLHTCIWLGVWASVFVVLAFAVFDRWPNSFVFIGLSSAIGVVFMVASVATGINWAIFEWWQRDVERRRAQAITPMLELVNAVSRLTHDQIGIVGLQDYRAILEIIGTETGPIYMLRTAGGDVPMQFVEDTLRKATPLGLPAVRTYADGSPEREWARLIAQWAVDMHMAYPANGPYSARWLERGGRYKTAQMLGLTIFDDSFQEVDDGANDE